MFARILVAVDGSAEANKALDFAIERAKLHGSELTIAFAVNRLAVAAATANPYAYVDPLPLLRSLDAEADAVLGAADRRAADAGLAVNQTRLDGPPAPAVLAYSRHANADAIVVGTHGRRGLPRMALGSTAEEVIRAATVPVFAIPARYAHVKPGSLSHVLVAIDGSPAADDAMTLALDIASAERADLALCSVAEPAGFDWDDIDRDLFFGSIEQRARLLLESAAKRAQDAGIQVATDLRRGVAAREIVASARACGAECIVIGTHGRAGIPRFVLGSVAEGVLRSSSLPVCTVRHH